MNFNDGHIGIEPGSMFGGRYQFQDLLGKGTFGKVVKVKDIHSERLMALKISLKRSGGNNSNVRLRKLDRTKKESLDGYDMAKEEVKILKTLNKFDAEQKELVIKLFDAFEADGRVFAVVELLSISVYDFQVQNSYHPFPAAQVQHILFQMCHALGFLHEQNIIHTDIKPENIVFVCGEYDETTTSDCKDNKASNSKWSKNRILRKTEIRLIDFGSAVFNKTSASNDFRISTREYRCIENILQLPWGPSADIWSLGCTILDLFCGFTLFENVKTDDDQLSLMEIYLGPLPEKYLEVAPKSFLDQRLLTTPDLMISMCETSNFHMKFKPQKLSRYFDFDFNNNHSSRIFSLMERMLEFIPEERITAQQALNSAAFFTLDPRLKDI